MSKAKQSGHSRLKAALVLRDALAFELGIDLPKAMRQLALAEETLGARQALDEGHFLAALHSVCSGDLDQINRLDSSVRTSCAQVRLAPRYAQYLGLLLFVCWLEAQRMDAAALLCRLNQWLTAHPPTGETLEPFVEADLQCAAFWMATAAGKTHMLHACLALLFRHHTWDRILLVTPSEALTRQHADRLREVGHWDVFAYPQDGDQSALGRLSPDTVIVLDINKLSDVKKGEGVTVPMTVFEDGRNLVFVDEGHKGQKSEESVWKRLQQDLAGIDAVQPRHRGMLIEFSATFGQVAEKEHAFGRYAKSVIFDYAYDRFHADLYGKDFWHVKLDGRGEADQAVRQQTMTAALLSFWHQVDCYRSGTARQQASELGLKVAAPLWVLLGLSVIGGSNKSDKEQTSDVIDVLRFIAEVVQRREQLTAWLHDVLEGTVVGCDLLPREVRATVAGKTTEELAHRILTDIFAWQPGDKPVLRLLKTATGELGIGLRRGDHVHYFGVVNVGDAGGLKKALEGAHLLVEDDALTSSLFEDLGRNDSGVNILIGSRRFAEGWDNYRAASLTLLRLGQGEGSLIIQMFGRVVRFAGKNGDGKRIAKPPAVLKPLQTAYLFGLRSAYLETFLNDLHANGVPESTHVECPTLLNLPIPTPLKSVRAIAPEKIEFVVEAKGASWLPRLTRVKLSLAASVTTTGLTSGGVTLSKGVAGEDITAIFRQQLVAIDLDAVHREMVEMKRTLRWWNFAFDREAIRAALESNRYEIFGLPSAMRISGEADLARLQRMATSIVRRLFESAYRKQENRRSRNARIEAQQSGIPVEYYKDFDYAAET